jgi:hypothetical protein
MTLHPHIAPIVLAGLGATAVMDLWLVVLARLGVQGLNIAFIGRWVGHLGRGTVAHAAIARADPIRHERPLGWFAHYATGIAFAALLVAIVGPDWIERPTPGPAVALGVATVLAPWGLMQPAMGLGFAASKTATPWRSALRSLANHAVFGLGLYLSAATLHRVASAT